MKNLIPKWGNKHLLYKLIDQNWTKWCYLKYFRSFKLLEFIRKMKNKLKERSFVAFWKQTLYSVSHIIEPQGALDHTFIASCKKKKTFKILNLRTRNFLLSPLVKYIQITIGVLSCWYLIVKLGGLYVKTSSPWLVQMCETVLSCLICSSVSSF